ncbi:ISWI chromatin-remodeling complex ATPase CHR17 [Glycine soja]
MASGNTVLQRKKSTVNSKDNETQNVEKNNDANVDNVRFEVEEKNKENVKEIEVEGKGDYESNDVAGNITKVQQEDKALETSAQAEAEENKAPEIVVAEGPNEESERGKDESLLGKNEQEKVKDVAVAEEKQPTEEKKDLENEKVDLSVKEETLPLMKEEESKDTNEEALVKEEENKNTNEEALVKEESKDTNEEALVKEEESKDTKEETLEKEEETKETTEQGKTLVKEGETKDANEQQRIRQPEKKINCDYRGDTQSILVALQVQGPMGRPSKTQVSNDFSSEEEEEEEDASAAASHQIVDDEEELEAVARSASSDDDDNSPDEAAEDDDEDKQDESNVDPEVSKREKARLREMQQLKKQKVQEILDAQNATIDADMNNRGKGRLNYLLQQTELFAHFAKGDQSSQKKAKGRGRHASKVTEEEEDEEYLKGEEDGLANTRLVTQPSCIQGKMRDYQLAGLNWLIRLYENGINGILADEMGLGKTLQTISLLGYLHEFRGITGPHMVVAPKSTLGNWMNEIRRFCPVLRAIKFLGNPDERKHIREELLVAGKFDVCVTSFEMVIKEKSALRRFSWRYIIIDEAHRIKNENSLLSKTMRLYNTNYRLLITGTPLQNNLHELWALLNFLLPEIFSSAETFDEWFQISGENDEHEVVQQLHKVLRPFLLRRLKSDVEKGLPPKKETILKVGMSQMQKQYYKALLQKDLEVVNAGGERKRLLNIAMQLRKCCNHPYLFQGAEPGPPFTTGDHLITNAGKMVLLDKLLPKLKERDSRVLIFSQMTRLLDILEDYLMFRGYQYCRIDGNTGGDDRDASIEAFNKPGSEKFVFLLSTRAGGLGINLATADVVILYDSDWNPQVDLQAQDRAHRIGQKKEVQVFRFCTEYTIEEKVIERAYKKLALDALVIQQGRLAEQKTVNKDELLQMVRFGAEMVFSSKDSTITDEDIDRIIAKGEEATAELDAKMKKFTEDAIKFKMDDTAELYDFDDEKDENKFDFKKIVSENWVEPPRRERKRNYSESEYFKQTMRQGGPTKPKEPRIPRMPQLHDFQFFNTHRLSELYEKEVRYLMQAHQKNQVKDSIDVDEPEEVGDPLTAEELEEKEQLLEEGFSSWSRKDFNAFIRACEKYGRNDIKGIASEMEGKTQEEVERYAKVFKERYKELNDYDRIIKNIERGEARISRKDEIMKAIGKKLDRYKNPWLELKIQYGQNKGKLYNEECDRFMICMIHKLGYGNWDELKAAFRMSPLFRFDWFVKSRTTQEITRRCDTLIRLVEKENQEYDERERQARKEKKLAAKSMTPSKRSMPRQTESPSLKKRKQLTMDDYLSSPSVLKITIKC